MARADRYDVVVLGGGPAGLTAALLAARTGRRVALVDRSATLGGMARSFEVSGVRVDLGSHRLHPSASPRVRALVTELIGADLQVRPRNGRLLISGTWVGFPLRAAELVRAIPRGAAVQLAAAAVLRPPPVARRRAEAATSYAEAVRAKLGGWMYREFYAPFGHKLWGLPGEQIDVEQARVRVSADSPWSVLSRVLRSGRTNGRNEQGRSFLYPRKGFGQIVDGLIEACRDAGVEVLTGRTVTGVASAPGEVTVRMADDVLTAGHVLSSIPLPLLATLAQIAPSTGAQLQLRAMVLVYRTHRGGRWTAYDAHYLPGRHTVVTRISEPANYRASADDPADRSVVCFEIPCQAGHGAWALSDEQLGDLTSSTLRDSRLPPIDDASPVTAVRLPNVYPRFQQGYAASLGPLQSWVDAQPRVTAIGRLGLFAHDNTHHAMESAFEAVAALRPDGTRDERLWALARERFAGHVVED